MKKPFKISLWLAGILAGILCLLGIGLWLLVNPNDFKPEIIRQVKQRTGWELIMPGDLVLSLFPVPGLKTGTLQLRNPNDPPDIMLAQLSTAELSLNWLPIFNNNITLKKLSVQGLSLYLQKNSQGVGNWISLDTTPSSPSNLPASIDQVTLKQAQITWDNQQSGQKIHANNLTLQAKPLALDRPVMLNASFQLDLGKPARHHALTVQTELKLASSLIYLKLNNVQLNSVSAGDGLPAGHLELATAIQQVVLDITEQRLTVAGIALQANNLMVQGQFTANQWLKNPVFEGAFRTPIFCLREFLAQQQVSLLRWQDPGAMTQVEAEMVWHANAHSFIVDTFKATLDQSNLKASGAYHYVDPAKITFAAEIDNIKLDRYLPVETAQPKTALTAAAVAAKTDQALAIFEQLKPLPIDGRFLIQHLQTQQLDMRGVSLDVRSLSALIQAH